MKKILLVGALALLALFSAEQQASAWLNFKFGAGINWAWQSGGNNTLWGLFRNGQPPGFGPQYDPSCLPSNQGCGQQGAGPFGCPQQGGAYMTQPGNCPQMPMQGGPMLPQQYPTGQTQGQFPYFPGLYPYSQDQFQYFGSAPAPTPAQPGSGSGSDASAQAANQNKNWYMTAQMQTPAQNWSSQYRGGYYPSYSTSNYYYPTSTTSYYPAGYSYPAQQPYYNSQSYYGYGYRR